MASETAFKELIGVLAVSVRHLLVCPSCRNLRGEDECPACQGELPNKYLIARIDDTLSRVEGL